MPEMISWKSEFSRSFKNLSELYLFLNWEVTPQLAEVTKTYPLFIPRRLAEKIKLQGPDGVLAREFLPRLEELDSDLNSTGLIDPIGDKNHHVAPQLIHRYHSRALFTPTTVCPVHCRYCFRKNELYQQEEIFEAQFDQTLKYLSDHPEISEIIFTGGNPFTLSDTKLHSYLESFATIKSIKDIRFHTRYPVILPERIDEGLLNVLSSASTKFRTLSVAIHANHAAEFDEEAKLAIQRLGQIKIQLLSQTVLLNGINDNSADLLELMNLFLDLKIRPYYLHHPDRVKGGMHFYLPLQKGRRLYATLRAQLPGWGLPHYVVDLPGGEGKISAFNPEKFAYSGEFLTLKGETIPLREPDLFV